MNTKNTIVGEIIFNTNINNHLKLFVNKNGKLIPGHILYMIKRIRRFYLDDDYTIPPNLCVKEKNKIKKELHIEKIEDLINEEKFKKLIKTKDLYICQNCFSISETSFCSKCNKKIKKTKNLKVSTLYKIIRNEDNVPIYLYVKRNFLTKTDNSVEKVIEEYIYKFDKLSCTYFRKEYLLNPYSFKFYEKGKDIKYYKITKNNNLFIKEIYMKNNKKVIENSRFRHTILTIDRFNFNQEFYKYPEEILSLYYLYRNNKIEETIKNYPFYSFLGISRILSILFKFDDNFFKNIFNNNYNKKTFKLISKLINEHNRNINNEILENLKTFNIENFFKKEGYNFLFSENIPYLYGNYKYINTIFKLIRNKDNANKLLEEIYSYFKYYKHFSSMDFTFHELTFGARKSLLISIIESENKIFYFKIIHYIYTKIFKYSETDFTYQLINNKNYSPYILNDINVFLNLLKNKRINKRKWKSILKNEFNNFEKETNINNLKYWEKLEKFMESVNDRLSNKKIDEKEARKIKIPFKYNNISIFEKEIDGYKFKVLKDYYDFYIASEKMHNCIKTYFDYIKNNNDKVIIILGYHNKQPVIAIELEYNAVLKEDDNKKKIIKIKNIEYKQALGKYNNPLNEQQKEIIEKYKNQLLKGNQNENKIKSI